MTEKITLHDLETAFEYVIEIERGYRAAMSMYNEAYFRFWKAHLPMPIGSIAIWTPQFNYGRRKTEPRPVVISGVVRRSVGTLCSPDEPPHVAVHEITRTKTASAFTAYAEIKELSKPDEETTHTLQHLGSYAGAYAPADAHSGTETGSAADAPAGIPPAEAPARAGAAAEVTDA